MAGSRRTVLLALMALAVPLPALAVSDQALEPAVVPGPAAISVSAALDSCGVMDRAIVCKINVAYTQIPGATSYGATVTAAGGSVTDLGAVGANATTVYVPYTGDGGYSVRITAYGAPEEPSAEGDENEGAEVIATGVARSGDQEARPRNAAEASEGESDAEATGRDAETTPIEASDGQLQAEAATPAAETPAPACEQQPAPAPAPPPLPEAPPLPEPPPEDLDPENPDEDADGIADADEKAAYDEALAAQQAAAAQPPPVPAPAAC